MTPREKNFIGHAAVDLKVKTATGIDRESTCERNDLRNGEEIYKYRIQDWGFELNVD